ncbi:MAG TPA: S8 family serine peptidase [Thermoanaerobaculia bacterium]|nr:S8 family serine peptidase [Thermoanaerobaculia bacterium]
MIIRTEPFFGPMRKLFAVVLMGTLAASANEISYRSLQSGSSFGPTPLHDRGIHGEGQIIAIIDTGLDISNCYFAEYDAQLPPFNTGTPAGGLDWENVDLTRRKVIAYDFLFSCDQYPGRPGCDTPGDLASYDNFGHGTHAAGAALGDKGAPIAHDYGDAVAPAAKLIVQDGGYVGGDVCTQFPGVGCPAKLTPVFEQAYKQGARIHSNSWGDRQGRLQNPPTANYPQSAYDVDAFVWSHPDSLVLFNTGNLGQKIATPASSLSAPGSAKNTLQVGGTRSASRADDTLAEFTLFGPTRDGRIKPDLVAAARVTGANWDFDHNPNTCDAGLDLGTSWSSPTMAGAAALVRQYYVDGFYPSGRRTAAHARIPSAALMKATLIAAARPVLRRSDILTNHTVDALPVPSPEQGWGFPVLDDALYLDGDTRKMRVVDVPLAQGLAEGESSTIRVNAKPGTQLRAVLVWTDPPGTVRSSITDTTPQLVNDLDLSVNAIAPSDRLNNVEVVKVDNPSGIYEITVKAHRLGFGPRQSYALVVTGDLEDFTVRRRVARH